MHPFVASSIAALRREAKDLDEALAHADLITARELTKVVLTRLTTIEQFQIRLENEARKAST